MAADVYAVAFVIDRAGNAADVLRCLDKDRLYVSVLEKLVSRGQPSGSRADDDRGLAVKFG